MITEKIGFACKMSEMHPTKGVVSIPECNTGTTTISWLNRQTKDVAEQKLWDLMVQNTESVYNLVQRVGAMNPHLRMVRISSDVLPAYTHAIWKYFWQRADVIAYCERAFDRIGDIARQNDVRLSMHPGQFTVLASESAAIVENSIAEFEYHADMARMMGYGKTLQDFKINVHISGKRGPAGIRAAYQRLSPEARNCITIENEENAWGLDDCLSLTDLLPIVLDVHHHFIKTGEYISPEDSRVTQVIDSWRGIRPTMHYSLSREDVLVGHSPDVLPDMAQLLAAGYKKQKMRAHSDFYWNKPANEWVLGFLKTHDIMCESKSKNLGSTQLFEQSNIFANSR